MVHFAKSERKGGLPQPESDCLGFVIFVGSRLLLDIPICKYRTMRNSVMYNGVTFEF